MRQVNFADLDADPGKKTIKIIQVVAFQHRHYVPLALISGFVLPTLIAAYFWDDAIGGLLYAGYMSRIVIWHGTFSINSFAHLIGTQDYTREISARGNLFLALLTNGEGHHNFHHEFPKDYRNGIKWYHYDPTKWAIAIGSWLGQAYDLQKTSENDIQKTRLTVAQQKIDEEKAKLDWGKKESSLPIMNQVEFNSLISEGHMLFILDDFVVEFAGFLDQHPGGRKLLLANVGKDVSTVFHGGLNNHSLSARLKVQSLRIAKFQ